ncbi:MAG: pyridoxamine 5'-phosphate oxidase family protein [Deltaproteobacteria bacterium]|nr:pyridoxamine 5'-phosphate oxidase family protein [Deltaproteobacteria bacterium]
MGDVTPEMPQRLLSYLSPGAPALLLTAGADGYPSSAYTWALALGPKLVRFAVDREGTAFANIQRSGLAGLHIIGPNDLAFLVKGTTRKLKDKIAAAPTELMLYEMKVIGARDQSFPGVTANPFTYEWPADHREAMLKMEQAVFAEMRETG